MYSIYMLKAQTLLALQDIRCLLPTHVSYGYVNNVGAACVRFLTFVFSFISPTGAAGSEQDRYHGRGKETLSNTVYDFC